MPPATASSKASMALNLRRRRRRVRRRASSKSASASSSATFAGLRSRVAITAASRSSARAPRGGSRGCGASAISARAWSSTAVALGRAGDRHAAAAAELEQALVAQQAQRAQHRVGVDAELGGEILRRRQPLARLASPSRIARRISAATCSKTSVESDAVDLHGASIASTMTRSSPIAAAELRDRAAEVERADLGVLEHLAAGAGEAHGAVLEHDAARAQPAGRRARSARRAGSCGPGGSSARPSRRRRRGSAGRAPSRARRG